MIGRYHYLTWVALLSCACTIGCSDEEAEHRNVSGNHAGGTSAFAGTDVQPRGGIVGGAATIGVRPGGTDSSGGAGAKMPMLAGMTAGIAGRGGGLAGVPNRAGAIVVSPEIGGMMAGAPQLSGTMAGMPASGGVMAGVPSLGGFIAGMPAAVGGSNLGGVLVAGHPDVGGHDLGGVIPIGGLFAGFALVGGAPPPGEQMPERVAMVAQDGSGDYVDLRSALRAGETKIFVRAGRYEVNAAVVFDRPDVTVRGENRELVHFVQTNDNADLFVVRADNVSISEVTLDTTMAGQAAFVQSDADLVTLKNSILNGGDNVFTIFFAGPDVAQGDETLAAYEMDNLSVGNQLVGNVINTSFVGDSVSFSLQRDGIVQDNTINGGMLAMYMLRNVLCLGNTVNNSPTNGIFVSLPVADLTVADNTVTASKYSAIVVKPQVEHPAAGRMNDSTGLTIEWNRLTSQYNGIEIDGTIGDPTQGQLLGVRISLNQIELNDFSGIYVLRAEQPIISENMITFNGADTSRRGQDGRLDIIDMVSAGIYADVEVNGARIDTNVITRSAAVDDMRVMQNAVVLNANTVTDATVRANTFRCVGNDWVHSPCDENFGDRDQNGVFDLTQGLHVFENNVCEHVEP